MIYLRCSSVRADEPPGHLCLWAFRWFPATMCRRGPLWSCVARESQQMWSAWSEMLAGIPARAACKTCRTETSSSIVCRVRVQRALYETRHRRPSASCVSFSSVSTLDACICFNILNKCVSRKRSSRASFISYNRQFSQSVKLYSTMR